MGFFEHTRTLTHKNPYPQPWVWVSGRSARNIPMGLVGKNLWRVPVYMRELAGTTGTGLVLDAPIT